MKDRDAFWSAFLAYGGLVLLLMYELAKSQHLF